MKAHLPLCGFGTRVPSFWKVPSRTSMNGGRSPRHASPQESQWPVAQGQGTHLSEPVALAYGLAKRAGDWQLFPKDEPLQLGGRRVECAHLCATDV